jgi:hypothetical protein
VAVHILNTIHHNVMPLGMLLMISVGRNSVHTEGVRPPLAVLLFLSSVSLNFRGTSTFWFKMELFMPKLLQLAQV